MAPSAQITAAQPVDARQERIRSHDPADFPVPTGREEEWRFTPLDRLRGLHAADPATLHADGKVVVEVAAAPGTQVDTVGRDDPRLGTVLVPADRVAAVAYAAFETATVITVPAGSADPEPTVVTLRGEGGTAFGHLRIDVGRSAGATVVLDHQGSAIYAGNLEIDVADGATLTLISLQDWESDAVHAGAQVVCLGRDARLRQVTVTLGGDLVRLTQTVKYAGPGGDAELLGLYFADAQQHLEHRLFVDHAVAHCRSRVTYKGALQGDEAHTVWIGDVLIRAEADGTDSYELNRNLLLTDGGRADSVPNLEIETGEVVQAGHASATGRFDDEQLFYLQARGIPADEARRLVVRGFFAEIIAQIDVPAFRERLDAAVDEELGRVLG
jgi:Fe-S cluster assembly protein SufD